jgi:hypothetical protein
VQRLEHIEIKRAVVQFYLGRGGIKDHAKALCCAESTVYSRVERAHQLLSTYFRERHDARMTEQRRVRALLEANKVGRPGSFTP